MATDVQRLDKTWTLLEQQTSRTLHDSLSQSSPHAKSSSDLTRSAYMHVFQHPCNNSWPLCVLSTSLPKDTRFQFYLTELSIGLASPPLGALPRSLVHMLQRESLKKDAWVYEFFVHAPLDSDPMYLAPILSDGRCSTRSVMAARPLAKTLSHLSSSTTEFHILFFFTKWLHCVDS